jgi:Flp pilus assembly protein CpaB
MSELNRLVDNGQAVTIFRNQLGSITAFAVPSDHEDVIIRMNDADEDGHLTDDFSVEKALSRLADKMMGIGQYGTAEPEEGE